jgi:hypothetical protein
MKLCLLKLLECNAILLLDDWQNSRGAMIEQKLAQDLGIKILLETKDLQKKV